jgi:hypothetical protein
MLWWIGGIIAAPIIWLLILNIVTFAIPEDIGAILLLKKELRKRRVPCEKMPAEFFEECYQEKLKGGFLNTTNYSSYDKSFAARLARKAELVKKTENLAYMIALWKQDHKNEIFIHRDFRHFKDIFEKYKI